MKNQLRVILLIMLVLICFNLVQSSLNSRKNEEQQKQIDQLCQMMFTMAELDGAIDRSGVTHGMEYCFFFADNTKGKVIIGEFDDKISYDTKPHLLIMGGIDKERIEEWNNRPLLYGKYKPIFN